MSDWIQTFTGKRFYPLDPKVDDIDIFDIAHALSLQCRFGGHCSDFYSVAQHSCEVAFKVPPHLALAGLLHDAAEAYLCDIPSPVKRDERFAFYREAEDRLMEKICQKFNIHPSYMKDVKFADEEVFGIEARSLFPEEMVKQWTYLKPDSGERITPVSSPAVARHGFLAIFAASNQ